VPRLPTMSRSDLPTGTVTFLFTDVEGSTRLLKHLGAAYGGVLGRHHDLVREIVERHGGREVDTQGEAFFVAFPRAKDAVAAAIDLQRAHVTESWPDGVEVRVRIGIHTAEPDLAQTGYVGMGLHRAARLCSLGHGGQVLLSRSTAGLVDEDETPDVVLRDLGEHLLKNLDRPERVYQVVAAGLEEHFPPLMSITELARKAEAAELPTGTVTFLVTDVADYSETVQSLGVQRVGPWLDCYDMVLTAVVEEHRGKIFELVGDSAVAVFARPGDAVSAGVRLAPALAAQQWPAHPPVLQIGIHTGEAERWESGGRSGYVGAAILRAVALSSAGEPGQVVVSSATEALLDAPSIPEIRLHSIGEHELRQFERPVQLYEAVAEVTLAS
jgi:class 3 adenylate cyclase